METGERDEAALEDKVRHWLEVSGKKSELQAKLRAELYSAIQTEIAFRRGKSATSREKMINWLVSQHLTTHRHWLTNSVFVTEGEMLPTARPQLTTRPDSLKQYETEVATPELVQTLLSDLDISQEMIRRYESKRESIISIAFSILGQQCQELGTGQTQRRELSVPESLRAIDKKYDEILEDFHQRRRETPTRDTEQHPCGNCQQREENKCSALDSDSSVYIEKKTKRFNKSNRKRDQSNSSPEMFQNEHFDLLHKKMDELLSSKEKDLSVIQDLKRQLAESEEKARSVREEMTQRELSLSKQKYEEKINNLQQIIEKQNESMKGQSSELLKLRSQINLQDLTERARAAHTQVKEGQVEHDTPTLDFLESIKNKLGNIEREERSIEEDFDDLCSAISCHDTLKIDN